LYFPTTEILNNISFEPEYQEKQSDPYLRLLNLKHELVNCKTEIDSYAEKYNQNTFIQQRDNFVQVLEELELYKNKIDAFINYDIFNKLDEEEGKDDEEKDKSQSMSSTKKEEFQSIFEKYNRITENLLSQIKLSQADVLNGVDPEFNIKYEICANPEQTMENLFSRISELEDMVNQLERAIGNWAIVRT
jgi:hypothetical protein